MSAYLRVEGAFEFGRSPRHRPSGGRREGAAATQVRAPRFAPSARARARPPSSILLFLLFPRLPLGAASLLAVPHVHMSHIGHRDRVTCHRSTLRASGQAVGDGAITPTARGTFREPWRGYGNPREGQRRTTRVARRQGQWLDPCPPRSRSPIASFPTIFASGAPRRRTLCSGHVHGTSMVGVVGIQIRFRPATRRQWCRPGP